jgi:hypothetical protein
MSFSKKKDPFDIVEHRVNENNQEFFDDLRMDEEEDAIEKMRERERMEEPPKEKANKYGWAFFLASMFIGIGITATIGAPLPLFVGMGGRIPVFCRSDLRTVHAAFFRQSIAKLPLHLVSTLRQVLLTPTQNREAPLLPIVSL